MTKCEKCDTWMMHEGGLCSACCNTLAVMRAKVAEHKDPDYQLAKAAFTVLRVLCPKYPDPAWTRAKFYLLNVDRDAYHWANTSTHHLMPRRRWQDKKENA